jgi:poly-gamma-glutamate capsule biosynthesis protein CapA/YwtB (metallophosphatase superfamily)
MFNRAIQSSMTPSFVHRLAAFAVTALLAACASLPPETAPQTSAPSLSAAAPVVKAPERPRILKVIAVGDIMLDGTARPVLGENGYDHPFRQVKRFFAGAQIVFGNLEGPLTTRGTPEQGKTYVFRSPPEKVGRALADAGFNVVSLANNHTLDFGAEGLAQTIETLDAVGIAHAGAGVNLNEARRPVILDVQGRRVAILAYSVTLPEHFYAEANKPGTAFAHEAYVRSDVIAARTQADIVLVSFHWGQEGKTVLRDYQIQLGRAAIDAGAAAVIGHHPHVLQGIEHYKDGVILYSLGNFTFGSYSKDAQVSAVAELIFEGNRLEALRLHPINVNNFEVVFQPQVLAGAAADRVAARLIDLSTARHTELANENGTAVLRIPARTARRDATR